MHPRSLSLLSLFVFSLFGALLSSPTHGHHDLRSRSRTSLAEHHKLHLVERKEKQKRPKNITYVKYSKMKPLDEMIPSDDIGAAYKKYQPYLYIDDGCKPYPAIDLKARIT